MPKLLFLACMDAKFGSGRYRTENRNIWENMGYSVSLKHGKYYSPEPPNPWTCASKLSLMCIDNISLVPNAMFKYTRFERNFRNTTFFVRLGQT